MDLQADPGTLVEADWNDARLILAVARCGTFSRAATALGLDQATVSRRVALLERRAGVPLFHRRRSGAVPTDAGLMLVERAEAAAESMEAFAKSLKGIGATAATPVRVSAPEGMVSYVLAPALVGIADGCPIHFDLAHLGPLPNVVFLPEHAEAADIELLFVAPGAEIDRPSSMRVRRLGCLTWVPVVGRPYAARHALPGSFAELRHHPLLDHVGYQYDAGLAPWNEQVSARSEGALLTAATSSSLHRPIVAGAGVALMPDFAPVIDQQIMILPVDVPRMTIDLWIAAHGDTLRDPRIRRLYDVMSTVFQASPYFADGARRR